MHEAKAAEATTELEKLCMRAHELYGPVTLERFGCGTWRVWYRNWHYRDGACSGGFAAQGASPEDALRALFALASKCHVGRGLSDYGCECSKDDVDY